MTWLGTMDAMVKLMEPLKDVRLKDGLNLRLSPIEGSIKAVDAALKAAGIECAVSYW
jgi:hypothetical protein